MDIEISLKSRYIIVATTEEERETILKGLQAEVIVDGDEAGEAVLDIDVDYPNPTPEKVTKVGDHKFPKGRKNLLKEISPHFSSGYLQMLWVPTEPYPKKKQALLTAGLDAKPLIDSEGAGEARL